MLIPLKNRTVEAQLAQLMPVPDRQGTALQTDAHRLGRPCADSRGNRLRAGGAFSFPDHLAAAVDNTDRGLLLRDVQHQGRREAAQLARQYGLSIGVPNLGGLHQLNSMLSVSIGGHTWGLAGASGFARRVVVMRLGRLFLDGSTQDVFAQVEALHTAGIKPPEVYQLAHGLLPGIQWERLVTPADLAERLAGQVHAVQQSEVQP